MQDHSETASDDTCVDCQSDASENSTCPDCLCCHVCCRCSAGEG